MLRPQTSTRVLGFLAVCTFLVAIVVTTHGDETAESSKRDSADSDRAAAASTLLEARCTDGSLVKLAILDERLLLKTRYGELSIPAAEVLQIEFATRIPDDVQRRIDAAIAQLASAEFQTREDASAQLFAYQERAYGALLRAQESPDLEVVHRAEQLLAKLRDTIGEERLEVHEQDVVYTVDSKIAGTIAAEALKVRTAQFGEQQLKLADLRTVAYPGAIEPSSKEVVPDPGSLAEFQGAVGKTISFRVTGVGQGGGFARGGIASGAVWGTDLYTLDSTLAVAAVHAGALRAGQAGVVRVTIVGPQASFEGSTRNGITTSGWGQFPGAFKFKR